jgi:hypothetical protein
MKIHQLSVNYLPEQDRIHARINTASSEEVRLWLTRRLMLGLWPLLSRLLTQHLLKLESAGSSLETADEGLKKMLADFRKEQFLQEADFDTPYDDAAQRALPLGPEPLLVTDVDASPLPSGRLRLSFNERLPGAAESRSFHVELDPKLMQGMMHLLEQALARSQWQEAFSSPVSVEDAPAEEGQREPGKPRYLN